MERVIYELVLLYQPIEDYIDQKENISTKLAAHNFYAKGEDEAVEAAYDYLEKAEPLPYFAILHSLDHHTAVFVNTYVSVINARIRRFARTKFQRFEVFPRP